MSGGGKRAKKEAYAQRLVDLLTSHGKILMVTVDNVGSNQMQLVRKALRNKATILMGKNTQMRRAIRLHSKEHPELASILPYIEGNVGLVFVKDDLSDVVETINNNKVAAPAKAGAIAPISVVVPAGPTGMEPTMTSFLQALNIASKINRGQVEILSDVQLIDAGDKVGQSEANLLQRLNILPFSYGLKMKMVYDNGFVYSPDLLDLTDDDVVDRFLDAVRNVAAASMASGVPTVASVPALVQKAYGNLVFASIGTDYEFEGTKEFKAYLADPEAFASVIAASAAPAASADAGGDDKPAAAAEEESDSDDFGGGGLFGGDDDDDW